MIKCPNCGASYYTTGASVTTAVYYPPVMKDGKNINPDGNITTTTCTCLKCRHDFLIKKQYGEIIEMQDRGVRNEPEVINENITVDFADSSATILSECITIQAPELKRQYIWDVLIERCDMIDKRLDRLEEKIASVST